MTGITITAGGGFGSTGFPGTGGNAFVRTGTISSVFIQGSPGTGTKENYEQKSSTEYVTLRNYGSGGGSGMMPNTGAQGGFRSFNTATLAGIKIIYPSSPSEPGGGGAGGNVFSFWGTFGAAGMVILHY